jgi:cell fate regulator YaaT (PSP1 superfamily)
MGAIGKFASADHRSYSSDSEVICRTARGLEVGKVICRLEQNDNASEKDGDLLRQVGSEDRAIIERLDRFRDRAFNACSDLIAQRGLNATLVDVEHVFDGQSIWFYFLGDVDPEVESLTDELAEVYESKVKFRKFAETLANGCGPDCGSGSSCGDCGSCKLSGGCGASKLAAGQNR